MSLEERCLEFLRDIDEAKGRWSGDPYDQHPYAEAYKPWFWEDDAKMLAAFIRSEAERLRAAP